MNDRRPTERSFGVSVGLVCAIAGSYSWWRGHLWFGPSLVEVGFAPMLTGLLVPSVLRGLNRAWWTLAWALDWINARILLSVFFAIVITPVGLARRLLGHDPLRRSRSHTGWSEYTARRRDLQHCEHLF